MRVRIHFENSQRGTAALELALLLPVLVLIFLAILELGRVVDAWVVATNAAREGARYAAHEGAKVPLQVDPVQYARNRVITYLSKGLAGRDDVTLPTAGEIAVTGAPGVAGNPVTVIVPLKVRIYTPWLHDLGLPDPIVIQGATTMRLQ